MIAEDADHRLQAEQIPRRELVSLIRSGFAGQPLQTVGVGRVEEEDSGESCITVVSK